MDALVRELYGSLGEELQMEQPLHRIGAAFRSHISALHSEDFGAHRRQVTIVSDDSGEDYLRTAEDYSQRWNGKNLWMERSLDGFLAQGWQHGDAVVARDELCASSYYRHFLKPLDIRYGLGIVLWKGQGLDLAVASFHRNHADQSYDDEDFAQINEVRPHLVNAYAIYRRMAALRTSMGTFRACFDRAPLGMIMLAGDGRVLELNEAAQQCLEDAGVNQLGGGRLEFPPALRRQFADALQALARPVPGPTRSLVLERMGADGAFARFVLHLCAIPGQLLTGVRPGTRVLGFIAPLDAEQGARMDEQILCQVLGLTLAEARVATAMQQSHDVTAAAHALGVRPSTVRAHLRAMHRKLAVRRNSELLQLVERVRVSAPLYRHA